MIAIEATEPGTEIGIDAPLGARNAIVTNLPFIGRQAAAGTTGQPATL